MNMPVQINEMVVRANINEPGEKKQQGAAAPAPIVNKDELVRECTEIIMELLKSKTER